jgi:hypothetical protein
LIWNLETAFFRNWICRILGLWSGIPCKLDL